MKAIGELWRVVLSAKVLMVLVVLASTCTAFNLAQFQSVYARWPDQSTPTFSSRLATWDGAHYLLLSQNGYLTGSHSCAFYPLWPAVIWLAGFLAAGNPLFMSLLLANALSLVAFWLFYQLVQRHHGTVVARDALILMLAFPGALFFAFPYTESLYLVLLLVFFWGLESKRYLWSAITACLLPLARPIGVFILLPLAWHFFERQRRLETDPPALEAHPGVITPAIGCSAVASKLSLWHWLLLLCPLLGYAAYFGMMYAWTGNAFEGFEAQKAYPNSPSIKNMFNLAGFFHALANVSTLDGMMDSTLDRLFFVLFLVLLPFIYRLNKTWFWYALSAGLVPAMTSWFMSYRRYIMVLFPVFIVLAQLISKTNSRWLFWYYVAFMAVLQAWAIKQFVNFSWAG